MIAENCRQGRQSRTESSGGHDVSVGQRNFMEIANLLCLWVKDLENSLHLWLAQEYRFKDLTIFGNMKPNFLKFCLPGGRAVLKSSWSCVFLDRSLFFYATIVLK